MVSQWKNRVTEKVKAYSLSVFAILFCIFVVIQDIKSSLVVLFVFMVIGVPVYLRTKARE
jgi:hypothetical protein